MMMQLIILLLCIIFVHVTNVKATVPSWANASVHWPYNNQAIISDDGYAGFVSTFSDNSEACPDNVRFECCKCGKSLCDHSEAPCPNGRRPCKVHKIKTGYACKHIHRLHSGCSDPHINATAMRRSNVVARAAGWVANGYAYSYSGIGDCTMETCGPDDVNCPIHTYQSVCNGLVAMSFRINSQCCGSKTCDEIKCSHDTLKPGDAMHLKIPHWILFRKWLNTTSVDALLASTSSPYASKILQEYLMENPTSVPDYEYWQMGGGFGKVNINFGKFNPKNFQACWKRKNIIED